MLLDNELIPASQATLVVQSRVPSSGYKQFWMLLVASF